MTSLRPLAPALLVASFVPVMLATPPALAQISIDSHGVRAGGTVIDATGVHTGRTRIDRGGVHAREGRGGLVIDDNGLTRSIDCRGGTLTINGNRNNLRLSNCRAITVAGNRNVVAARFAASGRLAVIGNRDTVTYAAGPRVSVAVSDLGTRNSVTRR